jgi:hypothetical protein
MFEAFWALGLGSSGRSSAFLCYETAAEKMVLISREEIAKEKEKKLSFFLLFLYPGNGLHEARTASSQCASCKNHFP